MASGTRTGNAKAARSLKDGMVNRFVDEMKRASLAVARLTEAKTKKEGYEEFTDCRLPDASASLSGSGLGRAHRFVTER